MWSTFLVKNLTLFIRWSKGGGLWDGGLAWVEISPKSSSSCCQVSLKSS
jgi:hypothetical protein